MENVNVMDFKRQARKIKNTAQSIPRLSYITIRHGLLPTGPRTLKILGTEGIKDLAWKTLGDNLVGVFRESGTVMTKMGQILATREDLLPPAVCQRLETLYNQQPSMSRWQLRKTLKRAYPEGIPFKEFYYKPLGVGSVGQVHRATLNDGSKVIVKLIRPGVGPSIERDLDALHSLLMLVFGIPTQHAKTMRFVITKALDDLGQGFRRETDLSQEARSLVTFKKRMKKNSKIYIPKVFSKHSSANVLVMEELDGEPLSEFKRRAKKDPEKARQLADLALKEILEQVFDSGQFHADPHAGNLFVLKDGRLGLIDLGLTGKFGPAERKQMVRALKAFLAKDPDGVLKALLGFGELPPDFDHEAFKAEVKQVVEKSREKVKKQVSGQSKDATGIEQFINDLFRVANRHRIHVPADATLLIKTLVTIEGVARGLNPELNLVKSAFPVVLRTLIPRWLRWMSGS